MVGEGRTPARAPRGWQLFLLTQPRAISPAGRVVALSGRAATLLAYLAVAGPTSRSALAALLWPEADGPAGRNNLRQLLLRLRRSVPVVRGREFLSLDEAVSVDLHRLRDLVLDGDVCAVFSEFSLCEDLPAVEDPAGEGFHLALRAEYARLRQAALTAAESRADRLACEGDLRGALALARAVADADPCSEAAWQRLIRLHHLNGDRGAALEAYRRCRESLREALDTDPSPETRALAEAVRLDGAAARTYVLHVSRGDGWGASLVDVATGRRQAFSDPAELAEFLAQRPEAPQALPSGRPRERAPEP